MRLLSFAAALALDAQSLAIAHLGLNPEQVTAILRNGKDYAESGKALGARGEALAKELKRETLASPLNVTRLDILHTESLMLHREWHRREAALVAANQALLTPAQVEKVRSLEQDEDVGFLIGAAVYAALIHSACAEGRSSTGVTRELIEHTGIEGELLKQLESRNTAFTRSLDELEIERSNNSGRITSIARAKEIDSEELGRLHAAQIAINREIVAQRQRHTLENRALLPANVLGQIQRIETAWRLNQTLNEVRDLHLLKIREGFFFSYGPSCY